MHQLSGEHLPIGLLRRRQSLLCRLLHHHRCKGGFHRRHALLRLCGTLICRRRARLMGPRSSCGRIVTHHLILRHRSASAALARAASSASLVSSSVSCARNPLASSSRLPLS
mmetsp:Transcript_2503/g.7432  ORF Transcript_2503/g.7432 Transcript_2503/m.7432 type:complete len:112 (+) Transcript_2503:123-458(+)